MRSGGGQFAILTRAISPAEWDAAAAANAAAGRPGLLRCSGDLRGAAELARDWERDRRVSFARLSASPAGRARASAPFHIIDHAAQLAAQ